MIRIPILQTQDSGLKPASKLMAGLSHDDVNQAGGIQFMVIILSTMPHLLSISDIFV